MKKQILILLLVGAISIESYQIYNINIQNSDLTVKIEKLQTENIALGQTLKATQTYATKESYIIEDYSARLNMDKDIIDPLGAYSKQDYLKAYKISIHNFKPSTTGIYAVTTDREFRFICQIVQAEINNGDFDQKVNVAAVIVNRYKSEYFPQTWEGILKQPYQFSSYSDGRYKRTKITQDTIEAIEYAWYFGSDDIKDATYFCSDKEMSSWHMNNLDKVYDDDKHTFFKRR